MSNTNELHTYTCQFCRKDSAVQVKLAKEDLPFSCIECWEKQMPEHVRTCVKFCEGVSEESLHLMTLVDIIEWRRKHFERLIKDNPTNKFFHGAMGEDESLLIYLDMPTCIDRGGHDE